jgi:hypothetical protein
MPLLTRINPDRLPYLVVNLPLHGDAAQRGTQPPTGALKPPVVKTA